MFLVRGGVMAAQAARPFLAIRLVGFDSPPGLFPAACGGYPPFWLWGAWATPHSQGMQLLKYRPTFYIQARGLRPSCGGIGQMNGWSALGLGALCTMLILAVEHWFPYTRELGLIEKYVIGVLALWFGFSLYCVLIGDWISSLALLAICGVGGLTVVAGYWLDEQKRNAAQARAAEARDDELAR